MCILVSLTWSSIRRCCLQVLMENCKQHWVYTEGSTQPSGGSKSSEPDLMRTFSVSHSCVLCCKYYFSRQMYRILCTIKLKLSKKCKSVSAFLFSHFEENSSWQRGFPEAELWAVGGAGLMLWSLGTWRAGPRRRSRHGWRAQTLISPCRPSRASRLRTPRPASSQRKQSALVRRMNNGWVDGWMNT